MKTKLLKLLSVICLVTAGVAGTAVAAQAITVYYKGTAVSWKYGRSWGTVSYSNVMSSVYWHGATANTTFSGWAKPGNLASATHFVGAGAAYAYWNCRG